MTAYGWDHMPSRDTIGDHRGPEDLEALELYERARQGLSRTMQEEEWES